MTPSAYRREIEAIETGTREITARRLLARSPRELIDAIAALDETPALLPHHDKSQEA